MENSVKNELYERVNLKPTDLTKVLVLEKIRNGALMLLAVLSSDSKGKIDSIFFYNLENYRKFVKENRHLTIACCELNKNTDLSFCKN